MKYSNISTGIKSEELFFKNNLFIYPNPAKRLINIRNGNNYSGELNISITNLQGKEVLKRKSFFNSTYSLDVSCLDNGIYIISVKNGSEKYINKLVIQK